MRCCRINTVNITKTNKHLISYVNGDDSDDGNSDGSRDDHELDIPKTKRIPLSSHDSKLMEDI